jgi:hypothetical protein
MSDIPIQIICGNCGSANVRRDAYADYDTEAQEWVLGAVFDEGHCEICEGESRLEELPLAEWRESLIEAHELNGVFYQAEEIAGGWHVSVFDDAGVNLFGTAGCLHFGDPLDTIEEALDRGRQAIMKEEFAR